MESLVVVVSTEGEGSMIHVTHGQSKVRDINTNLTKTTAALVQNVKQLLLVINVFVPLRTDKMAFTSILHKELESLTFYKCPISTTGGLNIDILKSNKLTKDSLCNLFGNSFHLTIIAPMRGSAEKNSCIDNIIVENIVEVMVKTLDDCFTDHFLLLLVFSIIGNVERWKGIKIIFLFEVSSKKHWKRKRANS